MNSNTVVLILGILFMTVWAGTSVYGNYTKMKSEIARVEGNSKDYQNLIQTFGDISAANTKAVKEAIELAIERLAEGRK